MRLDAYLAKEHPEHSRATWAKCIKAGFVTVNGKKISGSDPVTDKDKIDIDLPNLEVKPLDLPVIYEDENVIVIDKPVGVLTHSKGALNDEFTVSDFIRNRVETFGSDPRVGPEDDRGELKKGKRAERLGLASAKLGSADRSMRKTGGLSHASRFGIVHRLDRATSGVIIGAKNDETLKKLQRQFSDRKVKKTYLAVVERSPKVAGLDSRLRGNDTGGKEFRIDLPIARNPKAPSQFRVDSKGKSAITDVKVLKTYKNGQALLELKPQTGRTHQLRVHLSYIGSPIVGDSVYGDGGEDRMMLHAKELEITIPNGDRKVFIAKTPEEFDE